VWWKRVLPLTGIILREDRHTPEAAADAKSRGVLVRRAMAALPQIYRESLALYHLQDLPYREMEEITGIAVPALKQRVRRGSEMLRKKIAELYPELMPVRKKDS
jgi:DNA-directed RNA polymerase specialized sigma24 family protein